MSLNKMGSGYNSKDLYNIFLPGIPTVSTPRNILTPLQIVNIEYINKVTVMLETKISTAVKTIDTKISTTATTIETKISTINDNASQLSTILNKLENTVSLSNNYIHITDPIYYISTYTNIIIDATSIIYLPQTPSDGTSINIANNSGTSISINTQNNELIYSSFYINPNGSTNFILETSKMAKLINVNKNNLFSWVLLLS